ncbi:putative protein LONGIFOLIA [Helianthus annuus]|nr:putative protein LONGIFOLIA [Helianthus annuus]
MKDSVTPHRTVAGVRLQSMEKQIGCMSGFLQIFDRQQILAGKRIHSTKRLPSSTAVVASSETESSGYSPVVSASPDNSQLSPVEKMNYRSKSPVMVPTSSLKTSKEINTLSLEPLSYSDKKCSQTVAKPVLLRSVSEPRVSRSLDHSTYIDDNNFQLKQPNQSQKVQKINANDRNGRETSRRNCDLPKSFFDSTDFFPEPNQPTVTTHGDFEKKLNMRGITEHSKDLNTLKQILEVLQLKGLLRSTNRLSNIDSHRNFVYDRNLQLNKSNIVLVKPSRFVNNSRSTRQFVSEKSPAISPNRARAVDRSGKSLVRGRTCSANRIESNLKACNSISKAKTSNYEIERRENNSSCSLKISQLRSFRNQKLTESSSSVNSPKQKSMKPIVAKHELASTTESERCGKLLSRMAETGGATESLPSSAAVVPSPVSVVDSGFDTDELLTPLKCIDLEATPAFDFKEDDGIHKLSPTKHEEFISDDSDFIYISHILRASQHLHEDSNVFSSIEQHLYNNKSTSNVSKRQQKLIFDVVHEIIDKNKQLPPWKTLFEDTRASVKQIWSEFQKIREVNTGDGVLEVVNGVIKKDIVNISGWIDYPIEMSEAILDVERMIFKDLVSEAIRGLVELSGECMFFRTRRRLVF